MTNQSIFMEKALEQKFNKTECFTSVFCVCFGTRCKSTTISYKRVDENNRKKIFHSFISILTLNI